MSTDDTSLDQLRSEISAIDEEILKLAARRLELSKRVGEYKQRFQMPIKDYQVEKQVIEKARQRAAQLAIYPSMAESLIKTLIHYSVLHQDELTRRHEAHKKTSQKRALIVGGLGLMGQWFAHFFEALGYQITLNDVATSPESSPYFTYEPDLAKACGAADIIVLATPLAKTAAIMENIIPLKPQGLIIEICSLKTPVRTALQKTQQAHLRIASIHPMFGPDVDTLAGRNIILCQAGDEKSELEVEEILKTTSANIIKMELNKHDELMSYVLGASHIFNLLYATVMARSSNTLAAYEKVGGTTFKNQLEVTRAVVRENQDLYYEIQSYNQFTAELLDEIGQTLHDYQNTILSANRGEFKKLMEHARSYFDPATPEPS
jgi:chorismate mutase/prephenate dehydrogenase